MTETLGRGGSKGPFGTHVEHCAGGAIFLVYQLVQKLKKSLFRIELAAGEASNVNDLAAKPLSLKS